MSCLLVSVHEKTAECRSHFSIVLIITMCAGGTSQVIIFIVVPITGPIAQLEIMKDNWVRLCCAKCTTRRISGHGAIRINVGRDPTHNTTGIDGELCSLFSAGAATITGNKPGKSGRPWGILIKTICRIMCGVFLDGVGRHPRCGRGDEPAHTSSRNGQAVTPL